LRFLYRPSINRVGPSFLLYFIHISRCMVFHRSSINPLHSCSYLIQNLFLFLFSCFVGSITDFLSNSCPALHSILCCFVCRCVPLLLFIWFLHAVFCCCFSSSCHFECSEFILPRFDFVSGRRAYGRVKRVDSVWNSDNNMTQTLCITEH
jgi:hypothetical protein